MPDFTDPQFLTLAGIVAAFAAFSITLAGVAAWSRAGPKSQPQRQAQGEERRRAS